MKMSSKSEISRNPPQNDPKPSKSSRKTAKFLLFHLETLRNSKLKTSREKDRTINGIQ